MFFSGVGSGDDRARPVKAARERAARTWKRRSTSACAIVYDGGTKSVSLQIEDVCPRCHGTGTEGGHLCPQCHGTGRVLLNKDST